MNFLMYENAKRFLKWGCVLQTIILVEVIPHKI
jgi:hypothetical protein